MKKIFYFIAISVIFLSSCTGVKTLSTGLENDAFLQFIGNPNNYTEGLNVNIDDKTTFSAEVVKNNSDRPKGNVYAIPTGTHIVSISYKNNIIFKKQIFVGAQETKKIILP